MTKEIKELQQEIIELTQRLNRELNDFKAVTKDYEDSVNVIKGLIRLKADKLEEIKRGL
jgi:uncharacterized coiled-coil DUF342 family protein